MGCFGVNFRSSSRLPRAPEAEAGASRRRQSQPPGGSAAGRGLSHPAQPQPPAGPRPRTALLPQQPGQPVATVPAGAAAVTPEAQAALQNVQAAEARLPQLMDQLAKESGRAQAADDAARQLQQQHARVGQAATAELARRNQAVATAAAACDAAQARCDAVLGRDGPERDAAVPALATAKVTLEQARQSAARLDILMQKAQTKLDNGLPALQAFVDASRDAVQATEAARQAHTGVADHSLGAAHLATVEQEVARKEAAVAELHVRQRLAAAQLGPAGALQVERQLALGECQQARGECQRLEGDLERQRAGGGFKKLLGRALRPGSKQALQDARQRMGQAQQRLERAEAAITQQRKVAQDLNTQAHQALPELERLRDEVAQLRAGGAGQAAPQAQQADEQAQQARKQADDTERPALAAARGLLSSLDKLGAELAPPAAAGANAQDAPARTAWQRTADGVRGALKAWTDRTQPTRVDVTLGALNWSSATSGPTTFNGGHAPGRTVTDQAMREGALDAIARKTATAGTAAAGLLTGSAGASTPPDGTAARTPAAMRSAAAFTSEVARLFEPPAAAGPAAGAASLEGLAHTVFANRLLDHPNPDPAARPDGHPLRHEEALLIASALSAVTTDPAVAANVYNHLWNDTPALAGIERRNPALRSPMAGMATEPRGAEVSTDPQTVQLAHTARRVLAGSPAGMEALQHLQGLALPPADHPGRARAENALENYKLALRAEDALLNMLPVGGSQTTQDVLAVVRAAPAAQGLLDAGRLGTGKAGREDPATLASQALAYAEANMQRAPGAPEVHPEFKPAYVALRNGFTESGQGSDFNAMTKWLHKYVKYIDRASARKEPVSFLNVVGQAGRLLKHATGKDKSPLTTLLEAGPLGAELGQVPAEYKKQLGKTVNECAEVLGHHLAGNVRGMSAGDRTRGLVRQAALQLWSERLAASADPYAKISLPRADVEQRANEIAGRLQVRGAALDQAALQAEMGSHLAGPMTVKVLRTWFAKDQLVDPVAGRNSAASKLRKSFDMLEGKGKFVTELSEQQKQFDQGDPAQRREVLRQLLTSVVAGGDMADYSAGRKNAIGGTVGFSPAGVSVNGLTVGITPVVEASYDRTKSSVLRAGVGSNTGVLYLGREAKHAGSVGAGVRVGLEVAPGDFTLAAMGRLGGAHTKAQGSMIRTNKQGVEHEHLSPDENARMQATNWKRMTELAVNSIFDLAGAGPNKPANPHDMWAGMVDKVGDYQDMSFGYNRASNTTANWSLQGEGIAGVRFGPKSKKSLAGLQVLTGLKHTFFNRSKAGDSAGALKTFQGGSASRVTGAAAANLVFSHPTVKTSDGGAVTLLSRSKVGVESEMVFAASTGFVRLTTQDGRINPAVSFKQREYNVEGDFFKLVNSQRDTWEPRLGERGPDGLLHNGAQALDGFMQQVANLPPGRNRVFIERKNLTADAADAINACMARLGVLERGLQEHAVRDTQPPQGVLQEAGALRERIANELNNEANWQPFRLYVNQTNQLAKESSLVGAARYSPQDREEALAQQEDSAEAIERRGGRLMIGGHVRLARGARDLLTIDAQPAQA